MHSLAIITGDPEAENYVSKTKSRFWLNNWASRIDNSVVKYLQKTVNKNAYNVINVNLKDIDEDVFIKNDLIFYNLAGPVSANIISKNISQTLLNLLNKYSSKVYPPVKFGNLIYNKCDYYKHLQDNKIPIVPFFCVNSKEYFDNKNDRSFYEKLYNKILQKKWKGFIGKPVLGTSGIGFRMYPDINNVSKYEIYKQFEKQMKYVFETKQFPILLFQEKHEEFGSGQIPEIKMYYLDGKLIYAWVTADNKYILLGKGEKNTKFYVSKEQITHVKRFAKIVINVIKKTFGNKPLPLLRIDLGCCLNFNDKYTIGQMFLNEIEYAPAFILAKIPGKLKMNIDIKLAKQMLKIADNFFGKDNKQKIAILDRNPTIADDKMKFKRSWMPSKKPTSYNVEKYVWSPEVSSYWYIKKYHKNVNIDLIPFERIIDSKLMKMYDKVFIINHGLSDITPFWKNKANAYSAAWKQLGNKAFPSYKLAEFVYDKCTYYKYLQENGILTAPTLCYSTESKDSNINNFINKHKLNKIFLKPVGGDSGFGTSSHNKPFVSLKSTLTKMISNNGWKKVVVQKHMNFSSATNPEYKCLFIGDKLQYIIKSIKLGFFGGLIKSKDTYWKHKNKLIKMSIKVKKLFEKATDTKIIIYRVDWGYNKDTKEFFLNEFEHAPGWYSEDLIHTHKQLTIREWNGDVKLAKQIIIT